MKTLKLICLTVVQLIRQIPQHCRAMVQAWKSRRPPSPREIEAERIDRIRFPSKYRGK